MGVRSFSNFSYQLYLKEEKLMGSKCQRCGAIFLPPRPICIQCNQSDMEWIEIRGKGRLVAFTSIAVGPSFMVAEGHDRNHPYVLGVVELEEGVRVVGRIEGVDGNRPETIQIGTPLVVKFLHRGLGENVTVCLGFRSF